MTHNHSPNGRGHVSVTETERAGLAIERVANIEQWRGDARLASRFGDEPIVLEDVRDRCLDREIAGDEFRRLLAREPRPMKPIGYAAPIEPCLSYGRYFLGSGAVDDSACTMSRP